jgi:hypothetical protein
LKLDYSISATQSGTEDENNAGMGEIGGPPITTRPLSSAKGKPRRPREASPQGPGVESIIEALAAPRAAILCQLREMVMSLPDVEERTLYDGFCHEWTPAYYVAQRQVFHVHNFRSGLRATVFVNETILEMMAAGAKGAAAEAQAARVRPIGKRGPRALKMTLHTAEEIPGLMEIARMKWELAQN